MKFYRVLKNLDHDLENYHPGDFVWLDEESAASLVADGVVRKAERAEAIEAAIGDLPPGDAAAWTSGGKPEVRALREATGLENITAEERDAAWARHEAKGDE